MQAVTTVYRQTLSDYLSLTKPRITMLVLLTALAGMYLAAHGLPYWLRPPRRCSTVILTEILIR